MVLAKDEKEEDAASGRNLTLGTQSDGLQWVGSRNWSGAYKRTFGFASIPTFPRAWGRPPEMDLRLVRPAILDRDFGCSGPDQHLRLPSASSDKPVQGSAPFVDLSAVVHY